MSLATAAVPGRLEPSKVYWGKFECNKITFTSDVSDSLSGTYWLLDAPASEFDSSKVAVGYYVWYNNGVDSVDPAPGGKTAIEVSYTTNDDSLTIANNTETAINSLSPKRFTVSVADDVMTIENREFGATQTPSDNDTGFTFENITVGTGGDLGATNGGITLNIETETVDITSDQTGNYTLDQVNIGASVNMEMALQEMDAAKWSLMVGGVVGDDFTPAGGTAVTGMGEDKLYKNLLPLSGMLVLKPLSTADGDNSRNLTFWRSAPIPNTINFDNEIQALNVSFSAYLDPNKDNKINLWIFGDQDQDGLY